MKNIIIFLIIMSAIPNSLISQDKEDLQWLVRNGKGKDGIIGLDHNQYQSGSLGTNFTVYNISHPTVGILGNEPLNSFLAIYANGDYEFFELDTSFAGVYKFSNVPIISYLYLTNKYEDDDPPESLNVSTSASGSALSATGDYQFANHDIIDKRDITLIIDPIKLGLSSSSTYTLMYEVLDHPNLNDQITFSPSGFDPHSSKNALQNGVKTLLSFIDRKLTLPVISENLFLNFRVNDVDPVLVGKYIKFRIIDQIGNERKEIDSIQISGKYHDPNYVELKCVWNEGKVNKAKYRVQCFNDGDIGVYPISFSLNFPKVVDVNTLEILDWKVGDHPKCTGCNRVKNKVVIPSLLIDNGVQFRFSKICELEGKVESKKQLNNHFMALEQKPGKVREDQIAWIEFCVNINCDDNELSSIPLQPTVPYTTFDIENYSIVDYIDHTKCVSYEEESCYRTERKVGNYCGGCRCENILTPTPIKKK